MARTRSSGGINREGDTCSLSSLLEQVFAHTRFIKDACCQGLRWATPREGVQSHFGCGVLCLPQGVAIIRAFENLPIEVHGRLEPRCMVRALSDACIRRQIEAAPLSKLLKLVLVHTSGAERRHLSAVRPSPHKQAPLPRLYHHVPHRPLQLLKSSSASNPTTPTTQNAFCSNTTHLYETKPQ